jgi:hypothetical protein
LTVLFLKQGRISYQLRKVVIGRDLPECDKVMRYMSKEVRRHDDRVLICGKRS